LGSGAAGNGIHRALLTVVGVVLGVVSSDGARMNSFTANSTKLGFIGLGGMGSRIAARLLAAGYEISIFARKPAKRDAFKAKGARACESIAELAGSVRVVLSSLTDDQAVRDVYFGAVGVLANAKPDLVVIEMSTILPATSRELASRASEAGVQVLDVAVSGSTPAAEQGTLTLLAGGHPDVFQASLPIFQAIAAKYFHLGPSGAGTTMKMVVNAILGIGMQAIAEAAAMGEKAGLSREILLQVLSETAVIAPAYLGKLPKAARGDYGPQFPLPLMNKDFRLILQLAGEVQAVMPATSAAFEVNTETLGRHSESDFSAVMEYMEQASAKKGSSQFTTR
jgi:3-hydroxyisobutyrate dehydrogenase-like beta-hydroxyacid dehydrogenase